MANILLNYFVDNQTTFFFDVFPDWYRISLNTRNYWIEDNERIWENDIKTLVTSLRLKERLNKI